MSVTRFKMPTLRDKQEVRDQVENPRKESLVDEEVVVEKVEEVVEEVKVKKSKGRKK